VILLLAATVVKVQVQSEMHFVLKSSDLDWPTSFWDEADDVSDIAVAVGVVALTGVSCRFVFDVK